MKITIDTKEDSHEDIRKILALLSQLVNKEAPSNVFESPTSSALPSLMSMFDASPKSSEKPAVAEPELPKKKPSVELY